MGRNISLAARIMAILGWAMCLKTSASGLDESPAKSGEWGFRPEDGASAATNPPSFSWRPQPKAKAYEIQCSQDSSFQKPTYEARHISYSCHCPDQTFPPGTWYWRFRFIDETEKVSEYSQTRSFHLFEETIEFPMPKKETILERLPKSHPRLFLRPEELPRLREQAQGDMKAQYEELVRQCEKLLANPPATEEPPLYGKDVEQRSEAWREIWWGNRVYTIKVLDGAATLAFTHLLGGNEEYAQRSRQLLMEAARWDPKGSTGYRYNDEAGMPYAYYFSRTYTFLHDVLSEEERAICRQVMTIRGKEMYEHLCPRHLWTPYSSHSNRAWHFLGEVGIAFLDEIPEASEWIWFACNVFFNTYPVWCDDDGGWHEGVSYWRSYIDRFTWWADVMRVAMDIDAYRKPYFSKIGYYPMYLQPPGTRDGGFGDLCEHKTSDQNISLMSVLASQAKNPHWQWYVDSHGGPQPKAGYVGFLRGAASTVQGNPPTDLPTSRCFWGIGQAMLNLNLMDAKDNVQILFKSSPFGTQSHGYEAQNTFLLNVFGERLLIRTGKRDLYGSDHHRNWMWHTKSVNSITINGKTQWKRSPMAQGKILAFHTSESFDYVSGEAAGAYEVPVDRFTRHILFVKPDLILIYDQLETPEPSTLEWHLHSPTEMQMDSQDQIRASNEQAACTVAILVPQGLQLSQTDRFDPPPRPRVQLVEWHLSAKTPVPVKKTEFITLIRPYRAQEEKPLVADVIPLNKGYAVKTECEKGPVLFLLRNEKGKLRFEDRSLDGELGAYLLSQDIPGPSTLCVSDDMMQVHVQ